MKTKYKYIFFIMILFLACGAMQAHAGTLQILASKDSVISTIDCSGEYNVRITRPGMAGSDGRGYNMVDCNYMNNDIWSCKCSSKGQTNVTFNYNRNEIAQFNALISYDIKEGNRTFTRTNNVLFGTQIYYDKIKQQQDAINLVKAIIVVIVVIGIIVSIVYFMIKWLMKQGKDPDEGYDFVRDR